MNSTFLKWINDEDTVPTAVPSLVDHVEIPSTCLMDQDTVPEEASTLYCDSSTVLTTRLPSQRAKANQIRNQIINYLNSTANPAAIKHANERSGG